MPIFIKLLIFSISKKVLFIMVAKLYGFKRLYRRLLEVNRAISPNNAVKLYVRSFVGYSFRAPHRLFLRMKEKYPILNRMFGHPHPPPKQGSSGTGTSVTKSGTGASQTTDGKRQYHTAAMRASLFISPALGYRLGPSRISDLYTPATRNALPWWNSYAGFRPGPSSVMPAPSVLRGMPLSAPSRCLATQPNPLLANPFFSRTAAPLGAVPSGLFAPVLSSGAGRMPNQARRLS